MLKNVNILIPLFVLSLTAVAAQAETLLQVQDDCTYLRHKIESLKKTGGVVQMEQKLHVCRAPVFISYDNIQLDGGDKSKAIIKLQDWVHAPILVVGTKTGINNETGRFGTVRIVRNVKVSNLTLDGNKANHQTDKECYEHHCDGDAESIRNNGITIRGAYDAVVENVVAHSTISGGMVTEKDVLRLRVKNFESYNNFFDGFAGYETEQSVLENVHLHDNRGAGISIDIRFNNNKIVDSWLINNKDVGIFARDLSGNLFERVNITGSGSFGVFLAAAENPHTCAENNTFKNVLITKSYRAGIRVNDNCQGNKVIGKSDLNGNNLGGFVFTPNSCISEDIEGTVGKSARFRCMN